jgi:YopX protein
MTRAIEFRAWDHVHKGWIYFTVQHGLTKPLLSAAGGSVDEILSEWQQYTGRKDRDGQKIYEGDIISSGHLPKLKLEVRWLPVRAGFFPFVHDRKPKEYTIIGNIRENYDLIKIPSHERTEDNI